MEDINTYREMLRVNKHRLDVELELQPEVLERISTRISLLNVAVAEAQEALKRAEAEAFNAAKEAGETDKRAEQAKHVSRERSAALRAFLSAKQTQEEWAGLYEAWKSKGYTIKELTSLYVAQYFSLDPNHNIDRKERPQNASPRRDYSVERTTRERRVAR